jgi:hypothetical protein
MVDTPTTTYGLLKPQVGASSDTWGATINADLDALDDLLDGTTAIAPNLTASAWKVGGVAVTATAADLNILDGVTATTAELNILDGVTATAAELNYVDGVTSEIQPQIDAKVAKSGDAVSGGFTATADNDGTISSGIYTPTPVGGNFKAIINGGAFTLAAPSASGDYTLVIQITNSATAGAITFSGFSKSIGTAPSTVNGADFFIFITKCNGFTLASSQALQ